MPVRGVILDIDGTLIDSNDAHAKAFVEAFAEYGIEVPYGNVRPYVGMESGNVMARANGMDKNTDLGRRIDEARQRIFHDRYLPNLQAWPGAHDLLRTMHDKGIKLITASSSDGEVLEKLLQILDARELIDDIASTSAVAKGKPAPDIVHLALRTLGLPAEQAVMLGDTPYDVAAARGAGVTVVAVRCGGWDDAGLSDANAIYGGPADLLAAYDDSVLATG